MTDDRPSPARQLYAFHKILIGSAIALGLIMAAWGLLGLGGEGSGSRPVMGVVGVVAAVGFSLYLRWFLKSKGRS